MAFREQVQRQASRRRREMVRTGALLARREFLALLGVNETQLTSLVAAGSVFSLEVDSAEYFPAVLGDPTRDRARLHSVCRILVPAPSACRLDYLESRQADLGDISPLDALTDETLYRCLRRTARAWAAGWSRTIVKLYLGSYLEEPNDIEPTYTAVDEVDPRTGLWKRAVGALQAGGYVTPVGPYPRDHEVTAFITRNAVGDRSAVLEARLDLDVTSHVAHVSVVVSGTTHGTLSVPLAESDHVVDAVHKTIETIRRSDRQPD